MMKIPDDNGDDDDDGKDDDEVSYRIDCRWLWGVCWRDGSKSDIAAVYMMILVHSSF
jgi:hypothetical protein